MERLSAAYGRLLGFLALLAALLLLAMVGLITLDVVIRNVSPHAIPWADEVTEYALYALTLLTAPWLLRQGQHVRLDLLLGIIPARLAWVLEIVADLVGMAACLVMVRYGWIMTADSHRLGSITIKNLVFPEWWLLAPLPLFFGLIAIEFIFRIQRLVTGAHTKRQDAISVS
ncbi:MAG TPA: TRAP transporter small permease [Alphaproteobacteria bacterium]